MDTVTEKISEHKEKVYSLSFYLVIIGALNWGLLAVTGRDLFESYPVLDKKLTKKEDGISVSKIVYLAVGASGIALLMKKHM